MLLEHGRARAQIAPADRGLDDDKRSTANHVGSAGDPGSEDAREGGYWASRLASGKAEADIPNGAPAHALGVSDAPLPERLLTLARRAAAFADGMDFSFLFDRQRKIFSIGYRLADAEGPGRLDPSFYDLLASEARLTSFIAVAKGDVPQSHWFHLGRLVTNIEGRPTLLSWSATMFEYLMPRLYMKTYPGTLLDLSCQMAVRRQVSYAAERRVPWGISESAFNFVDRHGSYQYKAFGVPGLGLKRGLADELVVAPYATALATLVDPAAAVRNLKRLAGEGTEGRYGFYEAIDYTPRKTYEQAEGAHWRKLDAFLDLYCASLPSSAAERVCAMWRAWNGASGISVHDAWDAYWEHRAELTRHAQAWARRLAAGPELAAKLAEFCSGRLKY